MIRKFTAFVIALICVFNIYSQPWNYNLGTGTGIHTSGVSTTFLPAAPSGTSRVRVGSTGGSFNLENQLISFGSDSYLRIAAPTSTSVNKFSVYDFDSLKTFTLRFKMRLGASDGSNSGASSGTWYLFVGNGVSFSDNNSFTGAQCFTGIRFVFGSSGAITTNYRSAANWVATGISGTPVDQGLTYDIDIYGNNSTSTQTYTYGGSQSVAANTWDLWINGVLVGNDLAKALIPNDANIDSYMFYGENSAGNAANIFLDDITYTNVISQFPLPVVLNSFNAFASGRNALLNWSTGQEINNSGFFVERRMADLSSSNGSGEYSQWKSIAFVNGYGTTNEPKEYSFTDAGLNTGKYQYRLKQQDYNGNHEYFCLSNQESIIIGKPSSFYVCQNYPNPSNPKSKIDFQLPYDGKISLKVYDINGKEIEALIDGFRYAGYYSAEFDGSNLASGVYFYRVSLEGNYDKFVKTMKMVLVK